MIKRVSALSRLGMVDWLEGKTVKATIVGRYVDSICLLFTDGSHIKIGVERGYEGEDYFDLEEPLNMNEKLELGVITEEEYKSIKDAEQAKAKEAMEQRELEQLARLQRKYKDMR